MALTDERRAALLAYCKLTELSDDPEVATVVPALYDAAVAYMSGAGVSPPTAGTARAAQYDLVVNAMVLDAWDRRDMTETAGQVMENPVFRRMLTQLKLTEGMVSEPDTGT